MFNCKYCNKEIEKKRVLSAHQPRCAENPDRIADPKIDYDKRKNSNQWIKSSETGIPYILSDDARNKISERNRNRNWSQEARNKLSIAAKKRGLGGVTQSRWIKYKGKTLGSSYELEVAKSLDENDIKWDICSRFNYIDPKGKARTYTPDIYLIDYDLYLDPKNDFLINNINPSLGFKDCEKIKLVEEQNGVRIIILNKSQLSWQSINEIAEIV